MTIDQVPPPALPGDGSSALPVDRSPDQGPKAPGAVVPEPVYTTVEDWVIGASYAKLHDFSFYGPTDWQYHGHQVYDYTFLSLALLKRS